MKAYWEWMHSSTHSLTSEWSPFWTRWSREKRMRAY